MSTVQSPSERASYSTPSQRQEERTAELIGGGSAIEALGGIAAIALTILGLAGLFPPYMLAIAALAIGVSFLFQGGAIAARYSDLLREMNAVRRDTPELTTGIGVEMFGGCAGIVLGILAVLNVATMTLLPVAAMVFSVTLRFSSGCMARLNAVTVNGHDNWSDSTRRLAREAVNTAAGVQALAGIAGGVLGLLALLGIYPLDLTLIAMLTLAAAMTITGAAVSSRMMSLFQH